MGLGWDSLNTTGRKIFVIIICLVPKLPILKSNQGLAASLFYRRGGRMSKVWLITGSSRGLGRAFTVAALEAGHRVLAGARKPEQLADLENRFGKNIRIISLDVTNEEQAKRAVEMALETFG